MRRKRACDLCYKKKIQCDGDGDQCDWCTHHDLVCTYNRPSKKRTASSVGTSDQSLSKRIERLELILNAAKQLSHTREAKPADKGSEEDPITNSFHRQLNISGGSGHAETVLGDAIELNETLRDDASPFPLFHLGRFFLAGYHIGGIGSRNCLPSFSEAGYNWICSKTGEEPSFSKLRALEELCRKPPPSHKGREGAPAPAPVSDFVLPSRALVETIVDRFYESALYSIFPFIEPVIFRQTIEDVYNPGSACTKARLETSRAAMFSFLSATSLMDEFLDLQPACNVDTYATLAIRGIPHLLAEPGVTQCGALLAVATFYALYGHEYQATMMHSLACRALMVLNAHTVSPRVPPGGPMDDEGAKLYLRRLFWLAYTMDNEMSSRSGLGPAFSYEFIDLTLPETPLGACDHQPPSHQGDKSSPGHLGLSILRAKIGRTLYSATAFRKSEIEILCDIRELDEELEQWRLSIPFEARPRLHIPDGDAGNFQEADPTSLIDPTHVTILRLSYYYLLSAVHRASGRCRAWPGMDASELEGISSSLAISVQASRMTLYCLRTASPLIYKHAFWIVVFYPMSAVLAIFCNVLLDPLDPQAAKDLQEILAVPDALRRIRGQGPVSQDEAFPNMAKELCTELVRLGRCAIKRAQTDRDASSTSSSSTQSPIQE